MLNNWCKFKLFARVIIFCIFEETPTTHMNSSRNLIIDALENALTYEQYKAHWETLLQSETPHEYQSYYELNKVRFARVEKTVELLPEWSEVPTDFPLVIVAITEQWCGDAAQTIPVVEKLKSLFPNLETYYVLRDENLPLMDAFLTNGARNIPKLLLLEADQMGLLATWGPRPKALNKKVDEWKFQYGGMTEEVKVEIQKWYNQDRSVSTQKEWIECLKRELS